MTTADIETPEYMVSVDDIRRMLGMYPNSRLLNIYLERGIDISVSKATEYLCQEFKEKLSITPFVVTSEDVDHDDFSIPSECEVIILVPTFRVSDKVRLEQFQESMSRALTNRRAISKFYSDVTEALKVIIQTAHFQPIGLSFALPGLDFMHTRMLTDVHMKVTDRNMKTIHTSRVVEAPWKQPLEITKRITE